MTASTGIGIGEKGTSMKTGIYENMSAAEYHAVQAVSATALKTLASSPTPAHCRYRLDNPRESEAFLLGEALHCAVLENERWLKQWTASPKFDRRTNKGKADAAEFEERCVKDGLRCLDPSDYGAVAAMAGKVRAHPEAARILAATTHTELSLFWIDAGTGLLCKARIDALTDRALVDVKTTRNADEGAFSGDAVKLGYHIQLAHYAAGLRAHGLTRHEWTLLAVENAQPHEPVVYELEDKWQTEGTKIRQRLLTKMAKLIAADKWPGYPTDPVLLSYPAWESTEELSLTLDGSAVEM